MPLARNLERVYRPGFSPSPNADVPTMPLAEGPNARLSWRRDTHGTPVYVWRIWDDGGRWTEERCVGVMEAAVLYELLPRKRTEMPCGQAEGVPDGR